jgi:hypothetical protein
MWVTANELVFGFRQEDVTLITGASIAPDICATSTLVADVINVSTSSGELPWASQFNYLSLSLHLFKDPLSHRRQPVSQMKSHQRVFSNM